MWNAGRDSKATAMVIPEIDVLLLRETMNAGHGLVTGLEQGACVMMISIPLLRNMQSTFLILYHS